MNDNIILVLADDAPWFPDAHVGQALAFYDPDSYFGAGEFRFTSDPTEAIRFPSAADAFDEWKRVSTVRPIRHDGKPNRPLSAFTLKVMPIEDWKP
jgi:hypothetical protein